MFGINPIWGFGEPNNNGGNGAADLYLKLISATTRIPVRILTGSERGQLASSQDDENWADVISARQEQHVGPALLMPVINRLIWLGVLPEPTNTAVSIRWP